MNAAVEVDLHSVSTRPRGLEAHVFTVNLCRFTSKPGFLGLRPEIPFCSHSHTSATTCTDILSATIYDNSTRNTKLKPVFPRTSVRQQHLQQRLSKKTKPVFTYVTSSKMCQLCLISTITNGSRWPNPTTSSVEDVIFLATTCHEQYSSWQSKARTSQVSPSLSSATFSASVERSTTTPDIKVSKTAPKTLHEDTCLLVTAVKDLEDQRQSWWAGKFGMVRKLQDSCHEGDAEKATEIHKINNTTIGKIESVEARAGGFVKWALGIEGGVEALLKMDMIELKASKDVDGHEKGKDDKVVEMVRSMAFSG